MTEHSDMIAVRCEGCGSAWTDADLARERASNPRLLSCCPERKPLTIDQWRARAEAQSLSLSEAREEIERLKGLVDGIRECPQEPSSLEHVIDEISDAGIRLIAGSKDVATCRERIKACLFVSDALAAHSRDMLQRVGEAQRLERQTFRDAAAINVYNDRLKEALNDLLTRPTDGAARVRARATLAGVPALENGPAVLADANTNPPLPDLSSLRKGAEALCPHAPTYDAGLCCGHPDDCTFVSPSGLSKWASATEDGIRAKLLRLAKALHAKHYAHVPQWEPFEDAYGLIDQIDNMTAALVSGSREDGDGTP